MSISLWVYVNDFSNVDGRYQPFSLRSCSGGSYQFDIFSDGDIGYYWGENNYRKDFDLSKQTWYHIVVTGGSGSSELYLNKNSKLSGGGATNLTNCNDFAISQDGDGAGEHFDGKIDDLRIYNKYLTTKEIENIYDNTKP